MEKLTYLIVLLFSLVTAFTSCEKEKENEDENAPKKNEYTYDGVTKEIRWIGIPPESFDVYNYEIIILPTEPAEGEGLYDPQEYIYINTDLHLDGQNIDLITVPVNYKWGIESENPDVSLEGNGYNDTIEGDISGGTVCKKRLNCAYTFEITFNISFTNGKTLKGYYNGILKTGDIDTPFSTWQ
jgi:hypothetical protein